MIAKNEVQKCPENPAALDALSETMYVEVFPSSLGRVGMIWVDRVLRNCKLKSGLILAKGSELVNIGWDGEKEEQLLLLNSVPEDRKGDSRFAQEDLEIVAKSSQFKEEAPPVTR